MGRVAVPLLDPSWVQLSHHLMGAIVRTQLLLLLAIAEFATLGVCITYLFPDLLDGLGGVMEGQSREP